MRGRSSRVRSFLPDGRSGIVDDMLHAYVRYAEMACMTVRTVRAVFFDVNWTLVPHATKTIPTSTRQALATLRQSGVLAAVATDGTTSRGAEGSALGLPWETRARRPRARPTTSRRTATTRRAEHSRRLGYALLTFPSLSAQEGVEQLGRAGMRVNPTTELGGGHP